MIGESRDWALRVALAILFAVAVVPMGEGERKFHVLAILVGLTAILAPRLPRFRDVAMAPLLGFSLWGATSLLWSPNRAAGIGSLLWAVALLTVFAATRSAGREGALAAAWAFEVVALPTLAYGLAQYLGYFDRTAWASPYRLAGPFVNSNLYAAFAAVALLLTLGRLVAPKRTPPERVLAALGLVLAAASLPLTVSRGAWLGVFVALGWFVRARLGRATVRRYGVALAASTLAAIALLAATRLPRAAESIAQRLHGAGNYSIDHRLAIYAATLELIRQRPYGIGLGGYREAIRAFRVHSDRFEINFAHSDPLELVAVVGVPAFVAGLIFAMRALTPGWVKGARDRGLLGVLAAALCLSLLSVIDFPLRKPLLAVFVAAVAGGLSALGSRPQERRERWYLLPMLPGILAATLWRGETLRDRADALQEHGSPFAAVRAYAEADRWIWPGDPQTARAAGATYARLASAPGLGSVYLPRAVAWLDLAHARSPWRGEVELARAALARAAGQPDDALTHTRNALAISPRDGTVITEALRLATDLDDMYLATVVALNGITTTPDRTDPGRAVTLARLSYLPAETIVAHSDPSGPHSQDLRDALRAEGETLAADLLAARASQRWSRR